MTSGKNSTEYILKFIIKFKLNIINFIQHFWYLLLYYKDHFNLKSFLILNIYWKIKIFNYLLFLLEIKIKTRWKGAWGSVRLEFSPPKIPVVKVPNVNRRYCHVKIVLGKVKLFDVVKAAGPTTQLSRKHGPHFCGSQFLQD